MGKKEIELLTLINAQMVIFNDLMKTLVEEHLRHFREWRSKNGIQE